ncbi:MAG: hypothetical protein PHT31_06650 [Candidatus Omnitrophica bacterium]|nr:hypothetical protein [Candidatus Omnitrophota bacterium]
MIKNMLLPKRLCLIALAAFYAGLFSVYPLYAEDEQYFDPDAALDLSQQDNDGSQFSDDVFIEIDTQVANDNANWQNLEELLAVNTAPTFQQTNFSNQIQLQQPAITAAQTNMQLAQLLALQELFNPLTTNPFTSGNTGWSTSYGLNDIMGSPSSGIFFNNPYRYLYNAKYQNTMFNNPLNLYNDFSGINDPFMQFYFENPSLAPEDWFDQLGSAQKYKFKKIKPIRPYGTPQF